MKRMLINATNEDELRVALTYLDNKRNTKVYDFSVETSASNQTKNNIYLGVVSSLVPGLEAAFVEYDAGNGKSKNGFLPLKEIAPNCYYKGKRPLEKPITDETAPTDEADKEDAQPQSQGRLKITDVLKEGQHILVQVEKEERGTKGASLTTYISLAGSYLVLMPNSPNSGISRRIEGAERSDLRQVLDSINHRDGMGLIVRTAGIGKTSEELQHDLNQLTALWDAIKKAAENSKPPRLLYQESSLVNRALRDYLRSDVEQIIVDEDAAFEEAKSYLISTRPEFIERLILFKDAPLFTHYNVEAQIEAAFQRVVSLPSGGSIVIDHTEALTAIDVNSAKSKEGSNIEETALSTNTEAAHVIAEQLRLRDLGGLVIIDFIDMQEKNHRLQVEHALKDALHSDRARIQTGDISSFGLLEMSRQRLRPSLGDTTQIPCPRCTGQGTIRSVHSLSHTLLRLIEDQANKENTADVRAQVPIDIATYLLNEKKQDVAAIEARHGVMVYIIPNANLQSPHHILERTRKASSGSNDQTEERPSKTASYNMASKPKKEAQKTESKVVREKPAVDNAMINRTPAPKKKPMSLMKKIVDLFATTPAPKENKTPVRPGTAQGMGPAKRKNYKYRKNRAYGKKPGGPSAGGGTPPPSNAS